MHQKMESNMETTNNKIITVETTVKATVAEAWKLWTTPEDIIKWYSASPDWHTPHAANDLKAGGSFLFRMEAKDGSMGFDFTGTYDVINLNEYIEFTAGDNRKVKILFRGEGNQTHITESFEAEAVNSIEQQKAGWQAILDNFKKYTEIN